MGVYPPPPPCHPTTASACLWVLFASCPLLCGGAGWCLLLWQRPVCGYFFFFLLLWFIYFIFPPFHNKLNCFHLPKFEKVTGHRPSHTLPVVTPIIPPCFPFMISRPSLNELMPHDSRRSLLRMWLVAAAAAAFVLLPQVVVVDAAGGGRSSF